MKTGSVQQTKWSVLRTHLERALADGAWHDEAWLFGQVRCVIDPRLAARFWVRRYDWTTYRHGGEDRVPGSRVLLTCEERALEAGRWCVLRNNLYLLCRRGRLERGGLRYRLRQQKAP